MQGSAKQPAPRPGTAKRATAPAHERLNWDDVRLLLALCRSRTLGEAARRLAVDASTVSRRLAALEAALSATLFDRGREGIAATQAAEELLPVAEEIEHAMARFMGQAETFDREVSGAVRISSPPDTAEVLIVPLLPELRARHPNLRFHIDAGEGLVDMARRGADLALRIVRPEHGDLLVTRLLTVRWTLAASPALADRIGALRRWEDAPWIDWGDAFAHVPSARWRATHVGGAEPVLRSDAIRVQIAAVASGLGVALLPHPSVEPFGLVPLRLAPRLRKTAADWPANEVYLVTHRALRNVPRVRAVWEFLLERAGDRPR